MLSIDSVAASQELTDDVFRISREQREVLHPELVREISPRVKIQTVRT